MTLQGGAQSLQVASAGDRELLAISGLLDEVRYRQRAGLSNVVDAAEHYLEQGWLQGLDPRDGFDGEFLRPYYQASGRRGPPALTWLELSVIPGRRAPMNRPEAEWLANRIRTSRFLDTEAYADRLPTGLDPALHYAVIGELLGWPPSREFDPVFYLEAYEDVAQHRFSPLDHYIEFGHREGRRAVPAARRLEFPPLPDGRRPTVLIVMHEASRTGAPVLGWNIARLLAGTYDVVSVLMRGGALQEHFAATSSVTIGPMVWEEWTPAEMKRVAECLVDAYRPLYAVANSIETHLLVPALAKLGVPSVGLVHEFASYTRPLGKLQDLFNWATHIVFPAKLVAQSSYAAFPALARRRGVHVLAQGRAELPGNRASPPAADRDFVHDGDISKRVRRDDDSSAFVVLGLGQVQIRKGVDLFLVAAASVRRLAPELRVRFIWHGHGYDPSNDMAYSAYLAEQITRSDLAETVEILEAVEDLESVYANADVFFLSSRLDPQPNVGIDAVTRGIPTVCFDGACGTAEILSADPETRPLVVPHLDAYAAAEVICHLARDPVALVAMRKATARVGRAAYDMEAYVGQIDCWGQAAAAALRTEDLQTLIDADVLDADLALPPGVLAPGARGTERHVLQQWAVVGVALDQVSNPQFRRPCAGFHPQAYAQAHPAACVDGCENPLAHWLRAGRSQGHWSHEVFSPLNTVASISPAGRVALHAHFYYVLNAHDLFVRLSRNNTRCDLFLSTDTDSKAAQLRSVFAKHRGMVEIRVLPNRGRDIGPFLKGFADEIESGYDVFGHIHGKQSLGVDATMGNLWREFLWENLIGGMHPMLDLAVAVFATRPDLGLLIAEDPHLVGWDENRAIAETLAGRMGLTTPLDDFFDFPLGNMFWARPGALRPLLELDLAWESYPTEPIAGDGTLVHALERLVPYAARRAGLSVGGMRAPGTTW